MRDIMEGRDKMKYIITENEIVLGNVGHYELVMATYSKIVSGGHCKLENGKVKVWGKSNTFDVPSRKEDSEIIEKLLTK